MTFPQGGPGALPQQVCVRHPDRPTGLSCTRCGRPACPDCLRDAPVGQQCVDCVRAGQAQVRQPVTVAGAPLRTGQPLMTFILIGLNVIAFLVSAYQAQSIVHNFQSPLANEWALIPGLHGQWWRLITSGFMHIGPIHILLNMVSLYIIGRECEVVLGRLRFLVLYGVSLLGGSVCAYLFAHSASAGASGAVFGLMGALFVAILRLKLDPKSVIFVIVLNLVITFRLPYISWQAHVGGLIIGLLLMAAMVYAPPKYRTAVQASTAIGLTVILAALALTA